MSVTGILGKKIGMTQIFDEKGDVHPITVLQAGPCVITQLKTAAKDGYEAAQIGFVEFVKANRVTKPLAGHFAKADAPPVREIREVGLDNLVERMERNEFDLIAVGRAILSDPLWVSKIRSGNSAELEDFNAASLGELY